MAAPYDMSSIRQAMVGPGTDSRLWASWGTVDPETESQKSVDFDEDGQPYVNVTLQPYNVPLRCRVGQGVAGAGEGEWYPFIEGDEVFVAMSGGDERGGAVILARGSNKSDNWPSMVAGAETANNNFGFRRMRAPYIVETAASYLIRSAVTGSYFSLAATGELMLKNGDNHYIAVTSDFLTMQTADNSFLIQINLNDGLIVLQADQTILQLSPTADSMLLTTDRFLIGTNGASPTGHAVTVESVATFFHAFCTAVGVALAGPLTGAGLAAAAPAIINAAIAAMTVLPVSPFSAALAAVMLTPPDATGVKPGFGVSGLLLG